MNILEKWFGKWEIISKRKGVVEIGSLWRSGEVDCLIIIEKNNKSGKERAYIKLLSGLTKEIDIDFARSVK